MRSASSPTRVSRRSTSSATRRTRVRTTTRSLPTPARRDTLSCAPRTRSRSSRRSFRSERRGRIHPGVVTAEGTGLGGTWIRRWTRVFGKSLLSGIAFRFVPLRGSSGACEIWTRDVAATTTLGMRLLQRWSHNRTALGEPNKWHQVPNGPKSSPTVSRIRECSAQKAHGWPASFDRNSCASKESN